MHTFDVTILLPGQGTFHVTVTAYTHGDALREAEAQFAGCTVMNIQQVS